MAEMSYLDFDLLIERAGNKYQARVLNSPAGQASAAFRLPFSDLEVENFLLRVGRTRHGVRRLESPEMEAAKTFGGRLFDAVFTAEVRACLRSSLDEASRQGAGLRLRIRLANVPELADLPWEYLYNPTLNRFLTLSAETPLVRYLDLPERIQPLAVQPPLRVLVMIASPSDYPQLDVNQEWTKLQEALGDLERRGLIVLERLEEATLVALQRRLRQTEYHIFHFIGHGGFDQQAQDGMLVMEDDAGRGRQVSGNYLGTLLHDERTLRLAVLNACEGARASRTDPFAGTAQSLVQQGIPAVIAMQFEITDETAITFAHEFYSAVADGYPVDAALAEARKAIFAQGDDVEWATPVLYLRSPDGHIFDVARVSTEKREEIAPALAPAPTPVPAIPKLALPARWLWMGIAVLLGLLSLVFAVSKLPLFGPAPAPKYLLTVQIWDVVLDEKHAVIASQQFSGPATNGLSEEILQAVGNWITEQLKGKYSLDATLVQGHVYVPANLSKEELAVKTTPTVPIQLYFWVVEEGEKSRASLQQKQALANLGKDFFLEVSLSGYGTWMKRVTWNKELDEDFTLEPLPLGIGVEEFTGEKNVGLWLANYLTSNPRFLVKDPSTLKALQEKIAEDEAAIARNPQIQLEYRTSLGVDVIISGHYEKTK
jgi:hypothetical protein